MVFRLSTIPMKNLTSFFLTTFGHMTKIAFRGFKPTTIETGYPQFVVVLLPFFDHFVGLYIFSISDNITQPLCNAILACKSHWKLTQILFSGRPYSTLDLVAPLYIPSAHVSHFHNRKENLYKMLRSLNDLLVSLSSSTCIAH